MTRMSSGFRFGPQLVHYCSRRWFSSTPIRLRPPAAAAAAGTSTTQVGSIAFSPHRPITPNDSVTIPELIRLLGGPLNCDDAVAYDDPTSGLKLTHRQVDRDGRGFAAALLQIQGLARGDVVGVALPNCPQYASVLAGIWEAGLVASPMNPAYTKDELHRQLNDSEAKCVVTIPQFAPHFDPAASSTSTEPLKGIILVAPPGTPLPAYAHSYAEMIKTDLSVRPTGAETKFLSGSNVNVNTKETLALLPYSSGTTGLPKGVMISHHNMVSQLLQLTTPGLLRYEPGKERILGLLPFFHCFGFTVFCAHARAAGAHVHCLPRFSPQEFVGALRSHRPTVVHLVPPLLAFLVGSPDVGRDELASIRTIVAGAAPIGPTLIQKLREKAGREDLVLQEVYGCTELSAGATALPEGLASSKPGSCGVPFPSTEMKVMDVGVDGENPKERLTSATGQGLGPRQVGEICFRGPQMMEGYWKNPGATAETIRDGWLHTGDLGYYDEDNCLYIVDRIKELIKVKGFQVAPAELEDLLRTHPGVADTAVIGVPDKVGEAGQLPRAYIVRKAGSALTEKEIESFVQGKVAKYKELKGGVEFVDVIPKAASGKILRRELVKSYGDQRSGSKL